MYDSITLLVDRINDHFLERQNEVPNSFFSGKTGVEKVYTNLENLSVKYFGEKIIISGSFPRFLYGTNLQQFDFADTKTILEKISAALNIDVSHAQVTRIDLAINLPVAHAPRLYMATLGWIGKTMPRFIYENGNTVKFKNGRKEILFYDKVLEAIKHKIIPPEMCYPKYLLLFEIRFKKYITRILKTGGPVYGSWLYDPDFIRMLIEKVREDYFSIEKTKEDILDLPKIDSVKILDDYLHLGGIEKLIQIINNLPVADSNEK